MTQFKLGSISTGTLKPEDLAPVFIEELFNRGVDAGGVPEDMDELYEALNDVCPPFVYFGAHPGDGADFGFWPDMERLQETLTAATVEHTLTLPRNEEWEWQLEDEGVIINTNDHGNVTVMDLNRNVLWAVV